MSKLKTYFDLWSCSERSWSNIKIGMLSVMLFSSKTGAKVFLKPILMSQLSKSFFQILFPRVRRRRWGHWPFWRYWRFWCFGGRSSDSDIGIVWIPENKIHFSYPHKLASFTHTVWKFQDFSVTQILHEINFEEVRSSKTAIFANFGAMHFVDLVDFSLQKVQNFTKVEIQSF